MYTYLHGLTSFTLIRENTSTINFKLSRIVTAARILILLYSFWITHVAAAVYFIYFRIRFVFDLSVRTTAASALLPVINACYACAADGIPTEKLYSDIQNGIR